MSQKTPSVLGIDFGTTNTRIAYIDESGRPNIILNMEGDRATPSVVFFDGSNFIVGMEAKYNAILYPEQVVSEIKQHLGRSDWSFHYAKTDHSSEEIASYILRKLTQDVEIQLGFKVTDAIVAYPAYFSLNEQEAIIRAGEIAGLTVRKLITEPAAAAVADGVTKEDQIILIYDLGGHTFDISLLEIKDGAINIIAIGGDHNFGGKNWDDVIVTYLVEQWLLKTGIREDPLEDLETVQDLVNKAERAKIALTVRQKTDIAVSHAGRREKITLSRIKFNELTSNLLERTIQQIYTLLEETKEIGFGSFDQILLIGGSTRIPAIRERLGQEFNVPLRLSDPEEVIAKGAALYGAVRQKLRIIENQAKNLVSSEQSTQEPAISKRISIPNIFILLELDPNKPWNQVEFERQLQKKRQEWSRLVNLPTQKGIQARQNLEVIPELQRLARNETLRQTQAVEARKLNKKVYLNRLKEFDERLDLLQVKGHVLEGEFSRLIESFSDIFSESEIRKKLKVPIEKGKRATRRVALEPTEAKDIQRKLQGLDKANLYEFLGMEIQTDSRLLLHEAMRLYDGVQKKPTKTAKDTLTSELCGYCLAIFKSEIERSKYDETLRLQKYDELIRKIDLIAEVSRKVDAKQLELLMREARTNGLDPNEAQSVILEHATQKGIAILISEKTLRAITGQQKCGYCGFVNDKDKRFCITCKKPLNETCPKCNHLVATDDDSCQADNVK